MTSPLAAYSAVVATFRRPDALRSALTSLVDQTHRPSVIVVVDNDPECTASAIVDEFSVNAQVPVAFLPTGRNLGPAGAWARGVSSLRADNRRGAWLLVVDDDDGLGHPDLMSRLLQGCAVVPNAAACAAVGLRGASFRRRTGRLVRVDGLEGVPIEVDYLASGGAPLYRWDVLDQVGFFDEELFFGFEDLDQGLRLTEAGWSLWAIPLPSLHRVSDTSSVRTPWREYYKTRAQTTILRRHAGPSALTTLVVRSVLLGSIRVCAQTRDPAVAVARFKGLVDGMRGRLGPGEYAPDSNPAKSG